MHTEHRHIAVPPALIFFGLIWLMVAAGCDQPMIQNDLEVIKARGEIVLVTRNSATCYYEGPYGPSGFEYELAKAFADHLGVRLRPLVIEDEAEMVAALHRDEADIIAAGLPFGRQSARLLSLGPGYLEVTQQLVGRRGGPDIKELEHLQDLAIWTTGSSVRLEMLKELKEEYPELNWRVTTEHNTEELLQMVWNRNLPLTIVESNILSMNRRYYPELVVHFEMGAPNRLTWATSPKKRYLMRAMTKWFNEPSTKQFVQGLIEHYYSHLQDFDYVDLTRYRNRIESRLPKYQPYFEEAATRHHLDWQLIAALSYQESHWNPEAISFTGVRGIMMLTEETAKTLGLKDRLAAKESIYAGTRYLARLRRMVGDDVAEPDRTFLALAAYNIGFGHLKDARELARRMEKPANSWHGVRSVLPLLQQKKYYQTLEHGYARGNEAVQYVDRIRTYHKVLGMIISPPDKNGARVQIAPEKGEPEDVHTQPERSDASTTRGGWPETPDLGAGHDADAVHH